MTDKLNLDPVTEFWVKQAVLYAYKDAKHSVFDQETHGDHLTPKTARNYQVTKDYYHSKLEQVNSLGRLVKEWFPDSFDAKFVEYRASKWPK